MESIQKKFCLSDISKEKTIGKLKKHTSDEIDKIAIIHYEDIDQIQGFEHGYIFINDKFDILKSLFDNTNSETNLQFFTSKVPLYIICILS